jgi:hypothetical protein
MGFISGSVSFRRFVVIGEGPTMVDQDLLDKLDANALRPGEIGVPEEIEYGWSGGRHVLDANFSFERNAFADALHVALRVDTSKVPSSLKKAYQIMEEEAVAATNPSGFISKNQKRDVKDVVRRRLDDDLRSGKYRKSKLVPVLWDIPAGVVYAPAAGKNAEMLMELFERTFGLALLPISAGSQALRVLEPHGRRRDYEDSRPTRFVYGPEGESQYPEYPWTAKGPEPKDFFGNEFMVWLWHELEVKSGTLKTDAGEVTLMIEKSLDLDCAYGQTGKDGLRGDAPAKMPEAKDGLKSGKVPRRAGLIMDAAGHTFTLSLGAEGLSISSAKLPDVEEADDERAVFEERIGMLRDLSKAIDGLYATFLGVRCTSAWEGTTGNIRRWIQSTQKPIAAVA